MTNVLILVETKIEVSKINVISVQGLPVNVTAYGSDLCSFEGDL